ncbi:Bromodomain-domain-containing protein [Neolentinus lepideus HHB14362 ss-1]|uniref:Bromodomain-domain-containing protein n=1 Tax=Neolentinus lepideus HHB14362 ss-1 TaxID=1314782 RepID=A0A165VQY0_9AGAM|nr:Bromodomain-domain-containing protein [Neolentinus lepideus HHB14362 ss-1]
MSADFDDIDASSPNSLDGIIDSGSTEDVNYTTPRPSGSGIKLVLPALKFGKPLKKGKKIKGSSFILDEGIRKAPRPVKLKPLKEVLTKLIAQIKKKDDYAFFLQPVNVSQVPGYTDIVKQPMDFGTMTKNIRHGKYRSLDQFSNDFHLVLNNARAFNPPGSIYVTEANKIETWGDEHIAKARLSVIEHETDWNIDIEHEDSTYPEGDEERGTPMDIDGTATNAPSPSVTSAAATPAPGRRRRKVPQAPGTLSESIDEDGRLPGSKDGLGAFPYGSDWARLMLSLKLKGKKKRTKKERLKMERGGPPYAPDGSLDYAELDDPFSVLSILAPEQLEPPRLMPLYPPAPTSDPAQPGFITPVSLPPDRPLPSIDKSLCVRKRIPGRQIQRRHWTVNRSALTRGRGKAGDEDDFNSAPTQEPREAHALDYGSFAVLLGKLEEEMRARSDGAVLDTEQKVRNAIQSSVQSSGSHVNGPGTDGPAEWTDQEYWSKSNAVAAHGYVRDIVYGGVEGLAYVQSIARFIEPPRTQIPDPLDYSMSELGMPLAEYVEKNVIDPLTGGRHRLLSETVLRLSNPKAQVSSTVSDQIPRSLGVYPQATRALSLLRSITSHPIDMASLIQVPNELFVAESEWVGASYREMKLKEEEAEKEKKLAEEPAKNAAEYLAFAIKSHQEAEAATVGAANTTTFKEDSKFYQYVIDSSNRLFEELEERRKATGSVVIGEGVLEDPTVRKLRLSLLALAKRAPLDKIARLPPDLVPAHIRHVVPTLGS